MDALVPLLDLADRESSSESSEDSRDDVEDKEESGDRVRFNHKSWPNISYDTSLPAQHSYLGTDLEELSGRTVLDDNSVQKIPLLTLPGVILVPGQILPLQLYHPAAVSMMTNIIDSDRTFGLINSRYSGRTFTNSLDPIGTTAEIRSFRTEDSENVIQGLAVLRILAEGRQRFRVLETSVQSDGMMVGKVQILPDIVLGDPGLGARLKSLDRFRIAAPIVEENKENSLDIQSFGEQKRHDKYNFANYTPWPSFVYKQYDPGLLMHKIKSELRGWNNSLKSDRMPLQPREFSYWIAANLPLDDNQRIHLLSLDNDIQRLRCELRILEQYSVLKCADCFNQIADRKDIFSMSMQGPQGTYVNPSGYVHEVITLHNARGLVLSGRSSTEQSWFPGYAWRIAECEQCRSHMGWKYYAVDKKLQPVKFWAMCRASVTADLKSENAETDQENII